MNRVREIRQEKNMTQLDLAAKTNITPGNISEIENEKRVCYPGWRERLAIALNVEESYLFPKIDEEVK